MKKLVFAFALATLTLAFQSCQKDDPIKDIPQGLKAPEIPPAVLYTIPTYEIAPDSAGGTETEVLVRTPRNNWIHAGLSLLVWNGVVVINLAAPVGAIAEAFNHDVEYIGNSTFAWSYQYTAAPSAGGGTYNVTLTAQYISNEEVQWILNASQVGGFQDFDWVTAITATNQTEAEFTINRNPSNPEPYLRINSTYQPYNQKASVRLTNVIANDPGKGQYIEYAVDNMQTFNRAFHVFISTADMLDIEWNEPGHYGRVRHASFFGDAEWHCWDALLFDTNCN